MFIILYDNVYFFYIDFKEKNQIVIVLYIFSFFIKINKFILFFNYYLKVLFYLLFKF